MEKVILKVDGGIVEAIYIPEGIELIVRDYDMANSGDVSQEYIQLDQNNSPYVEILLTQEDE